MVFLLTLAVLVVTARVLYLQTVLAHFELVRCSNSRLVHVELRRQALVARSEGDLQPYPCPREVRVIALRVAGIPVWRRLRSVGLPPQIDARIDQLRAEEFDHLFKGDFQLHAAPR